MNKYTKIKFYRKYVNHYLKMLVTHCIKVIMPSKPVFEEYIGTVCRPSTSSSHNFTMRLTIGYHIHMVLLTQGRTTAPSY